MDQLDSLVIGIRADTTGFAQDIAAIRGQLEGPLASGAAKAGSAIDSALAKAIKSGSLGFADLEKVALTVLADIAASAVKADLGAIFGGGGGNSASGGGGLLGALAGAATSLFGGAPGRATGGPVSGGQAYVVGERGPELFVPTAAGRIAPAGAAPAGAVSVTVNVAVPAEASAGFMQRTGAQVARQVRAALDRANG